MASKKSKIKGKKSPSPKSSLNSVALTNVLKPFLDLEKRVFLTNEVKDESGKVTKTEDIPLDSDMGQQLVIGVVSELLRDTFAPYDLDHANNVLNGKALRGPQRKPKNPVVEEKSPEAEKALPPQKESRPSFDRFMSAVSAEVIPFVDFQGKVRIELPGDVESGFTNDWEITSKRVTAWLFRRYLTWYELRPSSSELKDAIEWLRGEAYLWGRGEPSDASAVSALDDDVIFIAVRDFCRGLEKVSDVRTERATFAYTVMQYAVKEVGRSLSDWPARPSDLSAKLKQSPELLMRLGLTFIVEHRREGSIWTFERVEPRADEHTGLVPNTSEGELMA